MSDLINITGLWRSEKGHLSGAQGGAVYFVFQNKDATGNQPQYTLCIGKRQKKEEQKTDYSEVGPPAVDKDDVPF